jgi:threonine dehydrogenase-like Zn-dependent dehydrogenase
MQATVLYGARDVRFEDSPDPAILETTDAIIRLPLTCICGSDLWPYRGIQPRTSSLHRKRSSRTSALLSTSWVDCPS